MSILILVLFSSTVVLQTNAIMFRLAPNAQKCLRDEMHGNQIVAGEYEITKAPGQKIDYVVCFIMFFHFYFISTFFYISGS